MELVKIIVSIGSWQITSLLSATSALTTLFESRISILGGGSILERFSADCVSSTSSSTSITALDLLLVGFIMDVLTASPVNPVEGCEEQLLRAESDARFRWNPFVQQLEERTSTSSSVPASLWKTSPSLPTS